MSHYVLHNPHDEASRAYVAEHGNDPDVLGVVWWFPPDEDDPNHEAHADDRSEWLMAGGTDQVGAFPALVTEGGDVLNWIAALGEPNTPSEVGVGDHSDPDLTNEALMNPELTPPGD